MSPRRSSFKTPEKLDSEVVQPSSSSLSLERWGSNSGPVARPDMREKAQSHDVLLASLKPSDTPPQFSSFSAPALDATSLDR
jgi:hypothetical protein